MDEVFLLCLKFSTPLSLSNQTSKVGYILFHSGEYPLEVLYVLSVDQINQWISS